MPPRRRPTLGPSALAAAAAVAAAAAPSRKGAGGGAAACGSACRRCGGPWRYSSACEEMSSTKMSSTSHSRHCKICKAWAAIDKRIEPHILEKQQGKGHHLSGGVFLHEAQVEGALHELRKVVRRRGSATVCETVFGAGHSAAMWLAVPNTTVISFDSMKRTYQQVSLRYLQGVQQTTFMREKQRRVTVVAGDTAATIPRFAADNPTLRCDIVHAAGTGREAADLAALRRVSHDGAWVMPAAAPRGRAQDAQWGAAVKQGLLCPTGGMTRAPPACRAAGIVRELHDGFVFRESIAKIDHEYCPARYCAADQQSAARSPPGPNPPAASASRSRAHSSSSGSRSHSSSRDDRRSSRDEKHHSSSGSSHRHGHSRDDTHSSRDHKRHRSHSRSKRVFTAGQMVTWSNSDADIPRGTVGKVVGTDAEGDVEVAFPKGRWHLDPGELHLAAEPSGGAPGTPAPTSPATRAATQPWTPVPGERRRGEGGRVPTKAVLSWPDVVEKKRELLGMPLPKVLEKYPRFAKRFARMSDRAKKRAMERWASEDPNGPTVWPKLRMWIRNDRFFDDDERRDAA